MFRNLALLDFTIDKVVNDQQLALDNLDQQIRSKALVAKPIVNGKEFETETIIDSLDPSCYSISVGKVHLASPKDAETALGNLSQGFLKWRDVPFAQRAEIIRKAGDIMAARRYELSALMIREAGKPWKEADADLVEAVDFCRYYADEMLRLGPAQVMGDRMGESNHYFYEPRGIAVIISPWNFPLAITCGMTTGALVTGNVVALKPSQQTSLIAYALAKILLEAGVPGDAFAFLPGSGSKLGSKLVEDPRTDMIAFTGSMGVGFDILAKAAKVQPGQKNIKKTILELGGKNAIIVDEDADLDEAIKGVVYSAFGYAGQKCSACSRVIIVGDAYQPFLTRLGQACEDIISGLAQDPSTFLGPIIDKDSQKRILSVIEYARTESLVLHMGKAPEGGYFVPATVFKDVKRESVLWKEEIFGPVLAATKADTFEQAVEMANDSQYALTGGIFSRSPKNLEYGYKNFRVGNLYINRSCTGALVYRQPFGGSKMSGIGSKAGGPDYLLQFMEPRCVTENTIRRGFAPEALK